MEQSEILQYLAELTGIEGHAFHRAILLEVVVWFVMIAAVIIDFSTGIRKARVLKIPRDSHGFRRSFEKFGDYGKVTGMLMLFDLLAILFGIYSLPYASGLAGVGVVHGIQIRAGESHGNTVGSGENDNPCRTTRQCPRPERNNRLIVEIQRGQRQRRQRQSAARSTQHVTKPYAK